MSRAASHRPDQYVIRAVHTTRYLETHTAYYGPYPRLSTAAAIADELDHRYRVRPMKLDGEPCSTSCYVETLMPPPRIDLPAFEDVPMF